MQKKQGITKLQSWYCHMVVCNCSYGWLFDLDFLSLFFFFYNYYYNYDSSYTIRKLSWENLRIKEKKLWGVWLSCCVCDLLICSQSELSNIFSKKESIEKTKTCWMLEGLSEVWLWHALLNRWWKISFFCRISRGFLHV